jgi:hypothetical protein
VKRSLVASLATALSLCATLAQAGPRQILVLRAEGTADAATRTTVDSQVLRLAKHIDGKVDAGDITLTDAAAAAGCNAADAACRDEILMTFAVDEIVTSTVTAGTNGQLNVTVRRVTKGSAPKVAQSTLAGGKAPEHTLDADIGPLFGVAAAATPPVSIAPAATEKQPPAANEPTPAPIGEAAPAPVDAQPQPIAQPPQPLPVMPEGAPRRKKEMIGMGIGGGMMLLGVLFWAGASSKQGEIDDAPADTPADFMHLQQLEKDADGLAGGGNLFFVGGLVVTAVSGYLYWRKGRHARSQTAQITPTVYPHGGGLVLTFGGLP